MKEKRFFIAINVRNCVSLLYEILFENLFDFIETNKINQLDKYNNKCQLKLSSCVFSFLRLFKPLDSDSHTILSKEKYFRTCKRRHDLL